MARLQPEFCTNDSLFSQKKLRIFPRNSRAFILWVRKKKTRKIPAKIPAKLPRKTKNIRRRASAGAQGEDYFRNGFRTDGISLALSLFSGSLNCDWRYYSCDRPILLVDSIASRGQIELRWPPLAPPVLVCLIFNKLKTTPTPNKNGS